jgi:hypothetical protein
LVPQLGLATLLPTPVMERYSAKTMVNKKRRKTKEKVIFDGY